MHTIKHMRTCLNRWTALGFLLGFSFFFFFFPKLTLNFSGCTCVYFQSIVQGFHCAVHRKHSGINRAETSCMLSESFSGIIFFRTTSVQMKIYCSYNCTTAEVQPLKAFSPFHLRSQSNSLDRHRIKHLFHALVKLGHMKRSLLIMKCMFKKAWSQV